VDDAFVIPSSGRPTPPSVQALRDRHEDADVGGMEVQLMAGVRVQVEQGEELYTLRLVGDHTRYEFCAEHELPGALAILCELDTSDPLTRRRVQVAARRIVSAR
jgi:hypothetical protein